jgi:glutaredoxin
MLSLLSRFVRPKTRWNVAHLTVTVYTRAQCCCCDNALSLLNDYQRRLGFTLEVVDVDSDPSLVALYDTTVPVVAVDGKVRFKGKVNPFLFERLLQGESRGRSVDA